MKLEYPLEQLDERGCPTQNQLHGHDDRLDNDCYPREVQAPAETLNCAIEPDTLSL